MPDIPLDSVGPQERISRVLLLNRYFNQNTGHISPQAFKPRTPKQRDEVYETSVYCTNKLDHQEIWNLGDEYVTKPHPKKYPVLARADLVAREVTDKDLQIVPHPTPHPCHANIRNWPNSPEEREMKAKMLAKAAQLVIR